MFTCVYTGLDAAHTEVGLRRERAYDELKTRLLLGDFLLNHRLGEERLAAQLGVSRTPVREALTRLHSEGLVVRAADGGYVPTVPDVAMMQHLYEVRIGLELDGLRRPAAHDTVHDPEQLIALRDRWVHLAADAGDEPDASFVSHDEDFHVALCGASGNPAFADVLRIVNARVRMVRMQDFLLPGRIRTTCAEHLAIIDAVLEGDLAEAERRFLDHLDASLALVEQRVLAAIARMTTGPTP